LQKLGLRRIEDLRLFGDDRFEAADLPEMTGER
jgi:hypothetical protein